MSYLQHEIKFVLPAFRVDAVRRYLRRACLQDAQYPAATVSTIYFDTPGLESLEEKRNSDYAKTKLRLRWYENDGAEGPSPAFLEIKKRLGSRREKHRLELDAGCHPLQMIRSGSLDDPRLRRLVCGAGPGDPSWRARLRPVLLLRYRRERYRDPINGARISLDSDILSVAAHPALKAPRGGRPAGSGLLSNAVVEFKSPSAWLPPALRHLTLLGCRRASFSKYEACFEAA